MFPLHRFGCRWVPSPGRGRRRVFSEDGAGALLYIFGFGMCGQAVPVGNEVHAVIFVLHLHEAFHRSEIVAKVQVARRPDSTYYFFHCFVL